MSARASKRLRCAIYTRKSTEEGLEQDFNSLDAQREACEAYIKSQAGEGWQLIRDRYDDGGLSGGTLERPALQQLLADIESRRVDVVVVYKVDRLTRALTDFAKMVEVFDRRGVSFVSITQQFNTTTSMGRLTLNVLLSFAQFEREVTGERIRDKIAQSKKKGLWMGGYVPLGYEAKDRTLVINEVEAETVRTLYRLYLELGSVRQVKEQADRRGLRSKTRESEDGRMSGGRSFSRGHLYSLLKNPLYAGRIAHKGSLFDGQHIPIIDATTWEAVQAKLASNARTRQSSSGAKEPSLLAGLITDDKGRRLTPSHAVKSGVRYRYYIRQSSGMNEPSYPDKPLRLPAKEIENLVTAAVQSFLDDPGRLIDAFGPNLESREITQFLEAAQNLTRRLPALQQAEQRSLLQIILGRIRIGQDKVQIDLRRNGIEGALLEREATGDDDPIKLIVPAHLKPCSGEMRLVIPPGGGAVLPPQLNDTLIKALARAHRWKQQLFSGEVPSIAAIAETEGVTERYVGRIMRLSILAPDIIEAILDGHQPADLELERLMKGLPVCWAEQRRMLGIA